MNRRFSAKGPNRYTKYLPYLFFALVLSVTVYVRIRLISVPLERDEGEFAYTGQLLLKGFPPFTHSYTMKLPGVSVAYALIMEIFGHSPAGIHEGLLVVNLLTVAALWSLACRIFHRCAALAACSSYAFMSLSSRVLGVFAQAEHFLVLFSVTGFALLLRYLDSGRFALLPACGLLFGLAFIMKQHAAPMIAFAVLYLLYRRRKKDASDMQKVAGESAVFLLSACIPYLLVVAWMLRSSVFDQFRFWTIQYAREYATGLTLAQGMKQLAAALTPMVTADPLLWLMSIGGGIVLCTSYGRRLDRIFLAGFFLFSFLAVSPGFLFRDHYFILLLPAAALLTGVAASELARVLSSGKLGARGELVVFLLLTAAVAIGLFNEREYFFTGTPLEVSRSIYGQNPFPEALTIADYLKSRSAPDDRVAILGSEPEILFYADRTSATGYIYMYGLMESQPYARQMQAEMIREIEAARPAYIVVVNVTTSWLRRQSSVDTVFSWCENYLRNFYTVTGIVDLIDGDTTRYFWDDNAVSSMPLSEDNILVYKRKPGV